MTLEEISKTIEAEVLTGRDSLKTEVEGLANRQVIYTADVADIHAICFIRGKKPDEETIKLAEQKGQVLMTTRLPMFVSCGRLFKNGLTGLGYLDISKRNDRG
jgi:predicted transcriptional regulator